MKISPINNLEELKIYDLVNEQYKFLTLNQLNQRHKSNLKRFHVMSLISALPKIWKEKLRANSEPIQDQKNNFKCRTVF